MKKIGLYFVVIDVTIAAVLVPMMILASFGFMLAGLAGCSAQPQTETLGPQVKITLTQTEVSTEAEERMANELYQKSHAMPEVLATTMSAFPTLAKECGLSEVDARSIDEELSCVLDGGEVQVKLLEQLRQILQDPSTEIKFYNCTGTVTQLALEIPEDVAPTPENVTIGEHEAELSEIMLMAVTVNYADGSSETGYFDTISDYRRTIFDEAEAQVNAARQTASNVDQDALAVIAQDMMGNIIS